MAKAKTIFDLPAVEKARIREIHPLDGALLLMHFAFRGLVTQADRYLQKHGLSRVHHRILYVLARTDGISVGELFQTLGITKQALHRPLKFLQDRGHVVAVRDPNHHRVKLLRLTPSGGRVERIASDHERAAMETALGTTSVAHQKAWRSIMIALARQA